MKRVANQKWWAIEMYRSAGLDGLASPWHWPERDWDWVNGKVALFKTKAGAKRGLKRASLPGKVVKVLIRIEVFA